MAKIPKKELALAEQAFEMKKYGAWRGVDKAKKAHAEVDDAAKGNAEMVLVASSTSSVTS
jgi:hypothetical protein